MTTWSDLWLSEVPLSNAPNLMQRVIVKIDGKAMFFRTFVWGYKLFRLTQFFLHYAKFWWRPFSTFLFCYQFCRFNVYTMISLDQHALPAYGADIFQ